MPPRFAYWTILVGGLPTAFRAAQREEIEPTFRRLRDKHPDAEMRWFARGKLWASPEEAKEATERLKAKSQRPTFADRDRSWRPGGSHRDPRQPYIDAKKRENQNRRERRFEFKKKGSGLPASGFRPPEDRPKWTDRPKGTGHRPLPTGSRPPQARSPRPAGEAKKWERPVPKWGPPRQDRKPESGERRPPKTVDRRSETDRPWTPKPAWKPKPKPWRGPEPGARSPRPAGEAKKWERPVPKWGPPRQDRRPETGDRRPPKTEDRRPKTEGGRGPGRTGWGGGARKGPGKGRRK
jgi:hypothetical protein